MSESVAAAVPVSDYESRKMREICTREGCRRKAAGDSAMCLRHHRAHKRADRESKQRKREARRAAKLCVWCPGPKPARASEGSTACQACRVKRGRIRIADAGVAQGVYQSRDASIAAATRVDPSGRTRYHGQGKRGQQPKSQLNVQDMRHIRTDFEGFAAGVHLMDSPEAETWSRGERERVEHATASLGQKASGRMDDILERLGHFKPRHGRRDGDK